MSEQELELMKQLETKERSISEDFLFMYLKALHENNNYKTVNNENVVVQK